MSDSSHDPSPKSGSSPSKTRSILLFGILALLLVALGFDYLVARPRVSDAYDEIAERQLEVNATANEILTDEDIHELLGKEPSRSFPDGTETVEVFSWASGVPFRTHDLFVVYQKSGSQQMFRRHSKFAYDPSSEVSRKDQVIEADPETEAAHQEAMEGYDGGGPPNSGGEAGETGAGDDAVGTAEGDSQTPEEETQGGSEDNRGGDAPGEASPEAANAEPGSGEGEEAP